METYRVENATGGLNIHFHKDYYEPMAITNAAFNFTDQVYIFIKPFDSNETVVRFELKKGVAADIEIIAKEFCNHVLDHQVRLDLEKMNGGIRDLIVKQAFSPLENLKLPK